MKINKKNKEKNKLIQLLIHYKNFTELQPTNPLQIRYKYKFATALRWNKAVAFLFVTILLQQEIIHCQLVLRLCIPFALDQYQIGCKCVINWQPSGTRFVTTLLQNPLQMGCKVARHLQQIFWVRDKSIANVWQSYKGVATDFLKR